MEEYNIRQGDQYSIPFSITFDCGIVTPSLIDSDSPDRSGDIEIVIGRLRKTYRSGQIKFNRKNMTFEFPLTQEETFSLRPGMRLKSQVRVKLKILADEGQNVIFGYDGPDVVVTRSVSREII